MGYASRDKGPHSSNSPTDIRLTPLIGVNKSPYFLNVLDVSDSCLSVSMNKLIVFPSTWESDLGKDPNPISFIARQMVKTLRVSELAYSTRALFSAKDTCKRVGVARAKNVKVYST